MAIRLLGLLAAAAPVAGAPAARQPDALAAPCLTHDCSVTAGLHGPAPTDDDTNACAVVAGENHDARLELFALGDDAIVYHKPQHRGGSSWASWTALPPSPPFRGGIEVVRSSAGRLLAAVCGKDGALRLAAQRNPGTMDDWSGWEKIGTPPDGGCKFRPALLVDAEGHAHVFSAAKSTGALWESARAAGSACDLTARTAADERCDVWRPLGGSASAPPTASLSSDGRVHVFITGPGGAVFARAQHTLAEGTHRWAEWRALVGASSAAAVPPALSSVHHMFHAFVRGHDHAAWHARQMPTDGGGGADGLAAKAASWLPWERLGGVLASAPAAAVDVMGMLHVLAIGADRGVWHTQQTVRELRNASSVDAQLAMRWANWSSLGGEASAAPAVVTRADGMLEVLIRGADRNLYRKPQFQAAGVLSWGAWEFVGGPVATFPC